MKYIIILLSLFLVSCQSSSTTQTEIAEDDQTVQINDRTKALDQYWTTFAAAAQAGDFEGMRSSYHPDAVLVKADTTISVAEAFKFRWKKEIHEVRDGKRANALEFRFSKRVGNDITAYEEGIYHYTSIETATGKTIGDSYTNFENLMVKHDGKWVALMEYQKTKATEQEFDALK